MESEKDPCPLCEKERVSERSSKTDKIHVKCVRCGNFSCSLKEKDEGIFNKNSWIPGLPEKLYVLSGALRWEKMKGYPSIRLTEDTIKALLSFEPETIFEKMDKIILFLYLRPDLTGPRNWEDSYEFKTDIDYPIAYANDSREFIFFRNKLTQQKLIEGISDPPGFRLTLEGFKRAERILRSQRDSSQAFIAMSFDQEMDDANDVIHDALRETNYKPLRLDDISDKYSGDISDRLIAEIKRSGLIVADFTENRAGVYYEAGFARGLGIPVIYTCRVDYEEKLHFDTNHINHIIWKDLSELKQKLIDRIVATVPRKKRIIR